MAVKALRKAKVYMKSDERILGDSDFAEQVLGQAQEADERRQALQAKGIDTNTVAWRVADHSESIFHTAACSTSAITLSPIFFSTTAKSYLD